MDCLKSIFSRLGLRRSPSRPWLIALEVSALGKLPIDLILHIAQSLPTDAAASFSLCCRPTYFILGAQSFKALEENGQLHHRYGLLMLLEREFPDHIACCYCKKLHAIKRAHRYVSSLKARSHAVSFSSCLMDDFERFTHLYIYKGLSFTIFQMAMKLHRRGLDCSKLLDPLSYKTKTETQLGWVKQCTYSFDSDRG
jgi:hypothetical protein